MMDHAITVGDIMPFVWAGLAILGLFGLGALLLFLISLFNPFRSGH